MTGKRVLLYVQHLLGVGHLKRSAVLADAMTRAGLEVTFVSGGLPVPGISVHAARVVQLPPAASADLSFKLLVDAGGRPVDDQWKQQRATMLLDTWRDCDPHVLLIELFPFGRRQMRFELLPLLDAACGAIHRPAIASSVRDVLGGGQKDPARQDQMLALFEKYFDALLVHGDPALVPFDETFRHASRLGTRLHYTGYVVEPGLSRNVDAQEVGKDEVIVSVGGGAVGEQLLHTALRARPLTTLAHHRWRLLAGVKVSDAQLQSLSNLALAHGGPGVMVERNRTDFARMLANCQLSISQGGYNTVMETLHADARAVIVPFAGGGESEQSLRADLLAKKGWIDVVHEAVLEPVTLAAAIDTAAVRPRREGPVARLDGASNSASLVGRWASERVW